MSDSESQPAPRRLLSRAEALGACVLGLLFLWRNGLPLGVGNQSLQMVWMHHLRNPELFAADPLIDSFGHFPSLFFPVLVRLIPGGTDLGAALQILQVANTLLLFTGVAALARSLFPSMRFPLLPPLFLAGGPLNALGETPLPPTAFTHTAFGLTLSVWILCFGFRRRWWWAFPLLGLAVNAHLLTAAYTGAILGLYLLFTLRDIAWRRLLAAVAVCGVISLPVLLEILHSETVYDAAWLDLLRERSAHHVFPSEWWRSGDTSWGVFLLWSGWLVWAVSLFPGRRPDAGSAAMMLAPAALMLLGALGSEWMPTPILLRAQLFRSSLYVVLLALIALPAALSFTGSRRDAAATALALLLLLAPPFRDFAAWGLAAAALWGWWRGFVRAPHAAALGAVFCLLTWSDVALSTRFWRPELPTVPTPETTLWLAAGWLVAAACGSRRGWTRLAAAGLAAGSLAGLAGVSSVPARPDADAWSDIQRLTRLHTPVDARILTPIRRSGFRTGSLRTVAGEWRDGTMQFFDPVFAAGWADRMRLLSPERLAGLHAEDWARLGAALDAGYVVLPPEEARGLVTVAENGEWVLAETRLAPPPPLPPPPEGVKDPESWLAQERFMLEVVEPNIRRHRMSRVRLEVTDADGTPLAGLPVEVEQVSRDFGIGSALHFFGPVERVEKQYHPPRNHPEELKRFLEVFDSSVIGFSGKWMYLEPERDVRRYEDLDAYVDWCVENGVRIEYHFVTGYEPAWMKDLPKEERLAELLEHAADLIDRYGDRIDLWQIVNEQRMQREAPEVFALFRVRLPGARLGVSHCARFTSDREGGRRLRDLTRGIDSMEQIQRAGQRVDFFAIHAHRPFGAWSDPRTMVEVLDAFQEKGVRVHISETGFSHAGKIEGEVRGGSWNEELQADYLERFLKVCYSHPSVDLVNMWGFGPETWQSHIGLLDKQYRPRPAFERLKRLVRDTWRTRLEGRTDARGGLPVTGFHGGYRVTLRHPDGRTGTGTFDLSAGSPTPLPVRISW